MQAPDGRVPAPASPSPDCSEGSLSVCASTTIDGSTRTSSLLSDHLAATPARPRPLPGHRETGRATLFNPRDRRHRRRRIQATDKGHHGRSGLLTDVVRPGDVGCARRIIPLKGTVPAPKRSSNLLKRLRKIFAMPVRPRSVTEIRYNIIFPP